MASTKMVGEIVLVDVVSVSDVTCHKDECESLRHYFNSAPNILEPNLT